MKNFFKRKVPTSGTDIMSFDHLRIRLKDIKRATNNFGPEYYIGRGEFGKVYKGQLLRGKDLFTFAFKRLDNRLGQGSPSPNFWEEIIMLSRYTHENLVSLVGFCDEKGERILVYEFLARGSLDRYLSTTKLSWSMRLQICICVARGLNYLHNPQGSQQRVLHGNIKSANILLDEDWHAKIADFGLIKFGLGNNIIFTTTIEGVTIGYLDPLYLSMGFLTIESDIYSFGVVLFEVLCGRLAVTRDRDGVTYLTELIYRHYLGGTLVDIIDPNLRGQMNKDSFDIYSAIAYQCLRFNREERPTVLEIVEELEKSLLALQQVGEVVKERPPFEYDFTFEDDLYKVGEVAKERPTDEDDFYKKENLEHLKIPLSEILSATNKFHVDHCIGWGGFGGVYKAELFHSDVRKYVEENGSNQVSMVELYGYPRRKSKVAVKRLDSAVGQGKKEFLQEIKVLSRLNHENLVSLLGFCDENDEMILVYEYASNGSLDKCIQNIQKGYSTPWQKRLQICLDMAHGLNYLHNLHVIHRDMKSGNILLGNNWEGKIGDLGLSRISKHANSQFSKTNVVGTPVYLDPNYVRTGEVSKQSDIYSIGVILLEVLLGRLAKPVVFGDDQEHLVHMAERHYKQKQLILYIDRHLKAEIEKSSSTKDNDNISDSINTFIEITHQCLHCTQNDDHQLTMEMVVNELKRALIFHSTGVETFSLESINNATNCFSEECVIGKGASGKIYCAKISLSTGPKMVALKRLDIVGSYGEGAFLKEVAMLSRYIHENIIPLRGFCEEENEKIIIFEHAINESLDKHLENSTLTWGHRLKISIGIAKGLHYIHTLDEDQPTIHGDIKSSNILLDDEWKATICDFFISKGNYGTFGYLDPLHSSLGLTKESDVYSFGVVLFEILSGRLAIEKVGKYPRHILPYIINVEPESNEGEANKDEQVVFLARVAARCFEINKLEEIIFDGIKEQTDAKSIHMFSDIAYQCLREDRKERPTMAQVLESLEIASIIHDEWESGQRLPRDYEKIVKMSRNLTPAITKKDLYSLLRSGILLDKEKVWFSICMDGVVNEMVSAKKFSYKNVSHLKWRSNRKSRFPKVVKILDISNMNIGIQIRTQFLTPEMMYGAYLVFKFCDRRKVSSRPIYVNLKYQMAGETLNAYFAEWKAESKWLTVELFRFLSKKGSTDFDVLLKGLSLYYCGSGGIFIEGIEFQAIRSVDLEENKELKDGKRVERLLNSEGEQKVIDYNEIIKRSGKDVQNASKEELYFHLSKGILIDKGEKLFSLSKVNKETCHMLPAKAVLHNPSNVMFCEPPIQSRCRFAEVAEILSHQDIRIKCDIETQMLSADTTYACFLVFKISEKCRGLKCPVKARDLLPNRKERTKIVYLTSPNTVNLDKIKWIPHEREDGWMEIRVWEIIYDNTHNDEFVPMDLKLTSFEGTMRGLIVCGIEFRPI